MLRRAGQWVDRNLWILPFLSFLLTELVLIALHYTQGDPLLLAKIKTDNRKDIYSSLTGSSSGS